MPMSELLKHVYLKNDARNLFILSKISLEENCMRNPHSLQDTIEWVEEMMFEIVIVKLIIFI